MFNALERKHASENCNLQLLNTDILLDHHVQRGGKKGFGGIQTAADGLFRLDETSFDLEKWKTFLLCEIEKKEREHVRQLT